MEIQQAGLGAAEEFLPRYTAQDTSPPPTYNDTNNVMTPSTNNEDLPPILAQPEAPTPPSPAHRARYSRIAIFAQMSASDVASATAAHEDEEQEKCGWGELVGGLFEFA
ncbi:hypothetical protein KC316_g10199 [Hortaea werneckii]|nr:hypothetical protein KC324_g14353 [Hortaea werneckii]KAI7577685.1 hypothetical protein KC316_g10199 [Hortaea werneckii]